MAERCFALLPQVSKSTMKSAKRPAKAAPRASATEPRAPSINRLLKVLSDSDRALLLPHLTEQPLPLLREGHGRRRGK